VMSFIRALTNPRRSMQRFGFLKYLIWHASLSATNNLSTLGKDLISAVSQKVSVVLTPHLQEYIKNVLTDRIYKNVRAIALKSPEESSCQPSVQVEVQDIYLSDANLPSRRGKLTSDDWNKYPYLALDLGLLRKGTYSLLVRGQSFLSIVSEKERKAFSRSGTIPLNEDVNPFRLTIQQKLLLLFSFIEEDGDVITRLYSKLLTFLKPFTDREAGDYLPEIYRSIAKENRSKARSGDDLLRVQKILDTADKIEAVKRNPNPGGKNSREHAITPRLEPFVDLGLLSKPDPFAYRYQITDATTTFFEPLIQAEDIDSFLRNSFFKSANEAFNLNAEHRADRDIILSTILKAYNVLKSPLGYVPILEVALLAGIYSITESRRYFEISEAIDTLKSLQKEKPDLVRFNVDRWGTLTFVKFSREIMNVRG